MIPARIHNRSKVNQRDTKRLLCLIWWFVLTSVVSSFPFLVFLSGMSSAHLAGGNRCARDHTSCGSCRPQCSHEFFPTVQFKVFLSFIYALSFPGQQLTQYVSSTVSLKRCYLVMGTNDKKSTPYQVAPYLPYKATQKSLQSLLQAYQRVPAVSSASAGQRVYPAQPLASAAAGTRWKAHSLIPDGSPSRNYVIIYHF